MIDVRIEARTSKYSLSEEVLEWPLFLYFFLSLTLSRSLSLSLSVPSLPPLSVAAGSSLAAEDGPRKATPIGSLLNPKGRISKK